MVTSSSSKSGAGSSTGSSSSSSARGSGSSSLNSTGSRGGGSNTRGPLLRGLLQRNTGKGQEQLSKTIPTGKRHSEHEETIPMKKRKVVAADKDADADATHLKRGETLVHKGSKGADPYIDAENKEIARLEKLLGIKSGKGECALARVYVSNNEVDENFTIAAAFQQSIRKQRTKQECGETEQGVRLIRGMCGNSNKQKFRQSVTNNMFYVYVDTVLLVPRAWAPTSATS